jgi:hypothetical protein
LRIYVFFLSGYGNLLYGNKQPLFQTSLLLFEKEMQKYLCIKQKQGSKKTHSMRKNNKVNEKKSNNLQNINLSSNLYVRPCLNMEKRDFV